MEKIPTIFERDFDGNPSRVLNVPHPDCAWVFAGEGVATRKYDGTCCMFDGSWWKRREVKKDKPIPEGFREAAHDETTGKRVGWMPLEPEDKWHIDAIERAPGRAHGTYELCGPKVQGNPEGFGRHIMISHKYAEVINPPREFDALADWLDGCGYEGVVFHHPDGRMAKIKTRDFGVKR